MIERVFVDTNVLIYAYDREAGDRHRKARAVVRELWETAAGVLSTQVLQEFYVNVTRKIRIPLARSEARRIIGRYSAWRVESIGPEEVVMASTMEEEHGLSFWDALIVTAAVRGGAARLLSEDLNAGQVLHGVRVENPFVENPGP